MAEPLAVIEQTLAPTFLVTGAAVYLNFVQARLFRVVDHIRRIAAGTAVDPSAKPVLLRRARILRNAILLGVLGLVLTVLTAGAILTSLLLGAVAGGQVAIWLFAGAMLALVASSAFAFFDTLLSVATVERQARS